MKFGSLVGRVPSAARHARRAVALFVLVFVLPLSAYGAVSWSKGWPPSWSAADWSSAGLLGSAEETPQAVVRVYAARTARWRGIFAVHTWLVVKRAGALRYARYEVVGWGDPVRQNAFDPDARWFSNMPHLVAAIDGEEAERLIPRIEAAITAYPFARRGDYRSLPGPNSNTFIAYVLAAVPEIDAHLPPTALGKDFPIDGRWFGLTPSRTGIRLNLAGYAGLTFGWVEGFEINIFGVVAGVDIHRPALALPGFGRVELYGRPA
jgi:Protein of unknown function (DUF3750)